MESVIENQDVVCIFAAMFLTGIVAGIGAFIVTGSYVLSVFKQGIYDVPD